MPRYQSAGAAIGAEHMEGRRWPEMNGDREFVMKFGVGREGGEGINREADSWHRNWVRKQRCKGDRVPCV
eukprot:765804-Rhodomonas_salina.1